MSGSGACPRCTEGSLELDPTDGFVICTSCGFVSDDTCLETQAWGQEGGGTAWRAAEGGGASGNGEALSEVEIHAISTMSVALVTFKRVTLQPCLGH